MIPRFIILKPTEEVLMHLESLGFVRKDNPITGDALVLGSSILSSTIVPQAKNPLIKVFESDQLQEITQIAELQKRWTNNVVKTELQLGAEKRGKVIVTTVGIMIDSCIIPILSFLAIVKVINNFSTPLIASHQATVNPNRPFITVGCDDYSLNDLLTIISAYNTLLESVS